MERLIIPDEKIEGGVVRTGEVDSISIQNAVETPFWMAIWAA